MLLKNFGHFERVQLVLANFELTLVKFICFGKFLISVNGQILNKQSIHPITLSLTASASVGVPLSIVK